MFKRNDSDQEAVTNAHSATSTTVVEPDPPSPVETDEHPGFTKQHGPSLSGCSLQGVRDMLEDTWLTVSVDGPSGKAHLVAALDGVGGLVGGADASAAAAEALRASAASLPMGVPDRVSDAAWMLRALIDAGWAATRSRGGATTVVAALIRERAESPYAVIGWIGDSRAHLLAADADQTELLTNDHHATELGEPAPLSRWLGATGNPGTPLHSPDIVTLDLRGGDLLILTTDGVHGVLDPQEFAALVRTSIASPRSSSASLSVCTEAIDLGSTDNCTCVIAPGVAGNHTD